MQLNKQLKISEFLINASESNYAYTVMYNRT